MDNIRIEVKPHVQGGTGQATFKHLLEEEQMGGKCRLYAEVTLYPGSSIGYHVHEGDAESYYILSGVADYNDNGKWRKVYPGEVTFTPDGFGHEIAPADDKPLVFMALIINS